MVRKKILAGIIGLASVGFFGVANAQPTVLGLSQLDNVTAAGGGGDCKSCDGKDYGKHWKKKKKNPGKRLGWCVPMNPHYNAKYCKTCKYK